jgi:hypothetical protein
MKLLRLFVVAVLAVLPATLSHAQWTEKEVEDVALKEISGHVVRVTWSAVPAVACGDTITYSVHRGTNEEFEVSEENRIAGGIIATYYISHEPIGPKEFYYRVVAVRVPGQCVPPALKSGIILTYPLDLGGEYTVKVGDITEKCKARSTAELTCITLPIFHAVVASQGLHEFLIGCLSSDYENNNWSCVNLKFGAYRVAAHSLTITVLDAGFSKVNMKTGKGLGPIIPEFSVLAVLR